MNRFRAYGRLDDAPVNDGDEGLLGVDEREPSLAAPHFVSEAVNYVFRNGRAKPRRGCVPPPWLNDACAPKWPWNFSESCTPPGPVCFEWPVSVLGEGGKVLAAGVFSDPNGREWIILAGNPAGAGATQVWYLRQGIKARKMVVPDDMPRLTRCAFTQCFDRMIMFRTTQYAELEMDDVRVGFHSIEQRENEITGEETYNPSDGTEQIPNAESGLFLQNRLFIPHDRDLIAASDFLNYTRFAPTRQDFRINQGSSDVLVGLYKIGENTLVAFKGSSIYMIRNVAGDLSALQNDEITKEIGLVGRQAAVGDGAEVYFVSQQGITSIGQVLDNKLRVKAGQAIERISDPIPKTWRRLNWRYASGIKATFHDGKLYFAVPLDDAEMTTGGVKYQGVNNAVLMYDTANRAWAGVHTAECLMVKDWFQFKDLGKMLLGFVSEDGRIYVYGLTFNDFVRPGPADTQGAMREIDTRLVLRGYDGMATEAAQGLAVPNGVKRWHWAEAKLGVWDSLVTVTARVDGVKEESILINGEDVDRRKRQRFDAEHYDVANPNDDHEREGRQDYSVDCTAVGAETGGKWGPILLGSGVNFEQVQDAPVRRRVNRQGANVQLVIENRKGRCEVVGGAVWGRAGTRRNGTLM
jgi:hypothetical protein